MERTPGWLAPVAFRDWGDMLENRRLTRPKTLKNFLGDAIVLF
jgi:hypothetical protein